MRKLLKKAAAVISAAVMMFCVPVFSPSGNLFSVTASASSDDLTKWEAKANYKTAFSVDTETVYGSGLFSIKIENKDYTISYVEKSLR